MLESHRLSKFLMDSKSKKIEDEKLISVEEQLASSKASLFPRICFAFSKNKLRHFQATGALASNRSLIKLKCPQVNWPPLEFVDLSRNSFIAEWLGIGSNVHGHFWCTAKPECIIEALAFKRKWGKMKLYVFASQERHKFLWIPMTSHFSREITDKMKADAPKVTQNTVLARCLTPASNDAR